MTRIIMNVYHRYHNVTHTMCRYDMKAHTEMSAVGDVEAAADDNDDLA